jgi:hypothetical protein
LFESAGADITAGTAVAEQGGAKLRRVEQTWAPVRLAKPAAAERRYEKRLLPVVDRMGGEEEWRAG